MPFPLACATTIAAAMLAVSACSNDTATYRDETVKFLEDDDGDAANEFGTSFTDVECEEPESTDVGTAYTCTGTDSEGASWTFDVEIDKEDSFIVNEATKQE